MTPWQRHNRKYRNCKRCDLASCRKKVVLARGQIPCKVLFIGEAPGTSEDLLGVPFIGPAGKLLDKIIADAGFNEPPTRYAFTNLVCCIPKVGSEKLSEPPKEAIQACIARLQAFVNLCKPIIIVCVGKLSNKYCYLNLETIPEERVPIETVQIIHPAAILRMDVSQKGLAIQRTIVTLADALEELTT